MTTTEIKDEIHKAVDKVPDSSLNEALAFLKALQSNTPERIKRAENFKKILKEDMELLTKLAK